MSETMRSDRIRQVIVAVTVLAAVVLAFVGSGAFGGTSIRDAAGGTFASDATVVAPAGAAFGIWSVIYLGLFGYAIWQAFPGQAAKATHRSVGYGIAASSLLNAVWIACVQASRIAESTVIIVVLLGVLLITFSRLRRRDRRGTIAEIVLIDGTIGLYLGWVTVATVANVAAWLASIGFDSWAEAPGWPGVIALFVAALFAVATGWSGGRWAPAAATAWGLAWIAVERWTGAPEAPAVAWTAVVLAVAVLAVSAWSFQRRIRRQKDASGN
ncbi:TspO/MBR family protein [Microbacterium sp.]|uniref:TspO/MBR family protein n=1 Tax=Microbacterium sp. TaxID=51671 RepID=UPI002811EB45|nr:TspO/MBR family protein [Microbacterium sp.]